MFQRVVLAKARTHNPRAAFAEDRQPPSLAERLRGMGPAFRQDDELRTTPRAAPYFVAEKRLSKEFGEMIGWAPATMASFADAGDRAEADSFSWPNGLRGGGLAACLVSADLVSAGLAFGFASAALDLAGAGADGGVVAVVSAVALPRPILWARLEKKPSDGAALAVATRVVAGADAAGAAGAAATATAGCSAGSGAWGGLTVPGMVPGSREFATSDKP